MYPSILDLIVDDNLVNSPCLTVRCLILKVRVVLGVQIRRFGTLDFRRLYVRAFFAPTVQEIE